MVDNNQSRQLLSPVSVPLGVSARDMVLAQQPAGDYTDAISDHHVKPHPVVCLLVPENATFHCHWGSRGQVDFRDESELASLLVAAYFAALKRSSFQQGSEQERLGWPGFVVSSPIIFAHV